MMQELPWFRALPALWFVFSLLEVPAIKYMTAGSLGLSQKNTFTISSIT